MTKESSDGSKAGYYDLPEGARQLGDLIAYRNLNHADGEMFCAIYRKGRASHSDALRDARKVLYYAQSEVKRLEALEQTRDEKEFPLVAVWPAADTASETVSRLLSMAHSDIQVVSFSFPHQFPVAPIRITWQDVAKLSAVHRVFIRSGVQWWEVVPEGHPDCSGSTICKGDMVFMVRRDSHKADV